MHSWQFVCGYLHGTTESWLNGVNYTTHCRSSRINMFDLVVPMTLLIFKEISIFLTYWHHLCTLLSFNPAMWLTLKWNGKMSQLIHHCLPKYFKVWINGIWGDVCFRKQRLKILQCPFNGLNLIRLNGNSVRFFVSILFMNPLCPPIEWILSWIPGFEPKANLICFMHSLCRPQRSFKKMLEDSKTNSVRQWMLRPPLHVINDFQNIVL